MCINDQIPLLETRVAALEELQRQLKEVRGRQSKLDKNLLDSYLKKAASQVSQIENSLDKGFVSLPDAELTRPEIVRREAQEPKMQTTPYTEQIEALGKFFDEVKESDLAKRCTKDFAEGTARSHVLPRHLESQRILAAQYFDKESQIARNIELVRARSQDLELSASQFLGGEEAYQKLLQAKKLDSLVNIDHTARPEAKIKLSQEMHEAYLREIIENGGAPSVHELSLKAEALGGHFYLQERLIKRAFNSISNFIDQKMDAEHKPQEKLKIDPRKQLVVETQSCIRKGQLAEAHSQINTLLSLMANDTKAHQAEEKIKELKFLIETHVFAGQFNSKLIDSLRLNYVKHLTFGPGQKPPQRRFVPYSSTL